MANESILIIDDSPLNLKLARVLLQSEGYVVRTAGDGNEALSILNTFKPSLILMDIQLPGIDGLEVTRRIKANPDTQGIIVVALTASAMKGDEGKVRRAGRDGARRVRLQRRDQTIDFVERGREVGVPVPDKGPAPKLNDVSDTGPDGGRLACVGGQLVHDDPAGAALTQPLEHLARPIPAPIVDEREIAGRMGIQERDKRRAAKTRRLVVAGNDYADFSHSWTGKNLAGAGDGDRTRDIKLGKLAFYR